MFGLTEIKTFDKKVNLLYFDYFDNQQFDKNDELESLKLNNNFTIQPCVKNIELQKIDFQFNKEKYVAEYLINNIKQSDVKTKDGNQLFDIDMNKILKSDIQLTNVELIKKIQSKLIGASNYFAANGRMGSTNTILLNANTYLNDNTNILIDAIKEYEINNNIKIFYSKYIPENTIYLINNTNADSAGFKIVSYNDLEGNEYYSAVGFGFFPEHQAIKINITHTIKEENKEIIDIFENISEFPEKRTLPLSECGLFVIYTLGTAGMSPKLAEQSIEQFKSDNADVNNYIGKHFKFYKEIWLTDDENRTNKVDFQLI